MIDWFNGLVRATIEWSEHQVVDGVTERPFHISRTVGAIPPAPVDALQPVGAHEPLDAFAAAPHSRGQPQLGVHSRRSVGAPRHLMDVADQLTERLIGGFTRRDGPASPVVVARRRHPEDPARHRHRDPAGGEIGDDRVDHFGRTFSRAK